MIRGEGDGHHAVVGEVKEGEICDKEEPEELCRGPLEAHHSIHYDGVICCLHKYVR